jgi:hypothetical protein
MFEWFCLLVEPFLANSGSMAQEGRVDARRLAFGCLFIVVGLLTLIVLLTGLR